MTIDIKNLQKLINERSYRSMLIEIIVKSFTYENSFNSLDGLKELLQERLNLNLKFETIVSDLETKNSQTFGRISFEDENTMIKVLDFTINNTGVVSEDFTK